MANTTISISIMSGKGGVGKTNIALNLAYALHQSDFSCLLMDCDMGLANLDVLLGIAPEGNIQDVLLGDARMEDVLCKVEPRGLDVLPAATGMPELAELDADMRALLLNRLNPVLGAYDYVFMDLGAGITDMVQAFAAMSILRLMVVTPEPTSLTDGYALIKVLAGRYGVRDFLVLVNQVENKQEEEQTFSRLHAACRRFLGIEPVLLGGVRQDPKLAEAVRRQEPLMRWAADSPAGTDLRAIAQRLQRIRLSMLDVIGQRDVLSISAPIGLPAM